MEIVITQRQGYIIKIHVNKKMCVPTVPVYNNQ